MRLIAATLFLAITGLLASPMAAAAPTSDRPLTLPSFKAEYSATYNGMPIVMVRTLVRKGDSFSATTNASNFIGTIREEETFRLNRSGQLEPARYHYRRAILGKTRVEESLFANGGRRVSGTYKERSVALESPTPLLSPLSYQIQMQLDSQRGGTEFRYDVAVRGKIKDYHYQVIRREKLDTPLGTLDTLVLERQRQDDQRRTLVWLAPKLHHLPVKLIQEEDGDHHEMWIKSYEATREGR